MPKRVSDELLARMLTGTDALLAEGFEVTSTSERLALDLRDERAAHEATRRELDEALALLRHVPDPSDDRTEEAADWWARWRTFLARYEPKPGQSAEGR